MDVLTAEKRSRPHHFFQSLAEAMDFIATCLERSASFQLLAELRNVGGQIGRAPTSIDRYKEIFAQLQAIHAQHDLRHLYRDDDFPADRDKHRLDGFLSRQADLDVEFIRLPQGWVVDTIRYL